MNLKLVIYRLQVGLYLLAGVALWHLAARGLWALSGPIIKYSKELKHYEPDFWNLPEPLSAQILLHFLAPQILYVLYAWGTIIVKLIWRKRN